MMKKKKSMDMISGKMRELPGWLAGMTNTSARNMLHEAHSSVEEEEIFHSLPAIFISISDSLLSDHRCARKECALGLFV